VHPQQTPHVCDRVALKWVSSAPGQAARPLGISQCRRAGHGLSLIICVLYAEVGIGLEGACRLIEARVRVRGLAAAIPPVGVVACAGCVAPGTRLVGLFPSPWLV
jgi:hypothetical protein